ncbi:hypothetical protein Q0N30_02070 [Priestia megaterium]|uniref:hypothetical protein n=1 Tax=Priestia megaterium TaxID=1404 RepID=UPI00345AE265
METLTKKQFADKWGKDGTLNGSKWQKAEKEISLLCNYEKIGKNRGTRYKINEIYDEPKQAIHGNTGKTPHNKGKLDKSSLKYQLAELLALTFGTNKLMDYQTKNSYIKILNITGGNMKHMESVFDDMKYADLVNTADKYVYKLIQNTQVSLNRLKNEAFDLIRKGTFSNVTLHEKLCVAFSDESHHIADEVLDEPEVLYSLYEQARAEAKLNVEVEYGTSMFFATRMQYIGYEYEELISSDATYQLLRDNKIAYFYYKYAIEGTIQLPELENMCVHEAESYESEPINTTEVIEQLTHEFMTKFTAHRKQTSVKHIDWLIKKGVSGDFLNKGIMLKFADEVLNLMFGDHDIVLFNKLYTRLMDDAKREYQYDLAEHVDEILDGMDGF